MINRPAEEPKSIPVKNSVKKVEVAPKPQQLQQKRSYYLRIAKIKSAEVYNEAWEIMSVTHKDILKGLKGALHTEEKSGGRSYYIHVGPVNSKDQADVLCKKIVANGGKCKVR